MSTTVTNITNRLKMALVGKEGYLFFKFSLLCNTFKSRCSFLKSLKRFHTVTFVTASGQDSG